MELYLKRVELLEGKMIGEDDAQKLIEQASSVLDEIQVTEIFGLVELRARLSLFNFRSWPN